MSESTDLSKPPENLSYMSCDEVSECLDGIKPGTTHELWDQVAKATEEGTAKPLGGDATIPSSPGVTGTTEEPIVSSGEYGTDLVAAWKNLSEEARKNIWEVAEKKRKEDDELWAKN